MRRAWYLLLLIFTGFLLAVGMSEASSGIRVDEARTRISFHTDRAEVSLVVNSSRVRPVTAKIRLELLNDTNRADATVEREETLNPGSNTIVADFALEASRFALWRRIRYEVAASSIGGITAPLASGVMSLSEISPDIFELTVVRPMIAAQGQRYHVRVRALHPVSLKPTGGVTVKAELKFDEPAPVQSASGVTDAQGYALLALDLPQQISGEGEITVTGSRNGLSAQAESTVRIDYAIRVAISSDKTIYQPGQTLHMRALVLDPSKRALAGSDLTVKILDPEGAAVHRSSLKTSRFGIASDDWAIPANTKLGDYKIDVQRVGSHEGDLYASSYTVRISRYELPNFTVNVKTDRSYYLPGQEAEIEVRGDYLFGQPVTRGRVRVVRETDREWNYREQKWDVNEEGRYEGELDPAGRFVARVDLKKERDNLNDRDYARFKDVSYAAYITDSSTNRTEQRRFYVRLTKEPIHIYVITDGSVVKDAPLRLYVSTFYADGTPAECEVAIDQDLSIETQGPRIPNGRRLGTVQTNRYGVAKIAVLAIRGPDRGTPGGRYYWDAELNFTAHDRKQMVGHASHSVWYDSRDLIHIQTDKALYKPGEPIEVDLLSTGRQSSLFVDVARQSKTVRSQTVSLTNGRGHITLPFSPDFKDEVTIAAYGYSSTTSEFTVGTRAVLYPRAHDLSLNLKMSQPRYRPGEEASVEFQVQSGEGQAAESALGVTIIDQALEERARTDSEFGARYDFARGFARLWSYEEEIGGVTLKSLERVDLSKTIGRDLQLVAEMLLRRRGYMLEAFGTYGVRPDVVFKSLFDAQLKPIKDTLATHYARKKLYPLNNAMLVRELNEFGLDFPNMRDPWETPYQALFTVRDDRDVLTIMSSGPDKLANTQDDFQVAVFDWPYFRPAGEAVDRAARQFHRRTGKFIRDQRTLRDELLRYGIDIDTLRDRWGSPYKFEFGISGTYFTVETKSAGMNRRFESKLDSRSDDFTVWTSKIDYFSRTRAKIDAALTSYVRATKSLPQEETQFKDALDRVSIDWQALRDGWGHRYYLTFKTDSWYRDSVRIIDYARYPEKARQRTEIIPVTHRINFIYVRSSGEDGQEGTMDDFDAAKYSRIFVEQAAQDPAPRLLTRASIFAGATGAITGVVADSMDAAIAGASVKATSKWSTLLYESKTNDAGRFLLENLPAGLYEVKFDAAGFKPTVISHVEVNSSNVTELDATLTVGAVTETVTVTGSAEAIQTTKSLSVSEVSRPTNPPIATMKQSTLMSTPRLREYFPETLVWQPSLETDASGRARLNFKLADNITTWKMSVVASNADGEIGTIEKDILAFQPFFIEHDPPRVLTEGDEIALPVVLRNYLDKTQTVDLEIKPAPWFTLLGPSRKRSEVASGDAAREVFNFRAVASIDDGKQRITATGTEASDAVERPVAVHPNGEEIVQTSAQLFSDSARMDIAIPNSAIQNSTRGELKIYPNLMAQVVESIEAIMQRPYGCAEQTISSAYPSLMLLRTYKPNGDAPPVIQKARRFLQTGYDRLLNYRGEDGGFTYWGRGESDPALTAYALRFLNDAKRLITVDEDVIDDARDWLVKQQHPDGSWFGNYYSDSDRARTASLTAFVARVLASYAKAASPPVAGDAIRKNEAASAALKRSLDFLARRIDELDEPHLIASYALAALDAGEQGGASRAINKLRSFARDEGVGSYWALETNTPFNGWGLPGRIEATALAVQALASSGRIAKNTSDRPPIGVTDGLANRGLLFLLRQKDCYGVWYSSQATVNVLEALVAILETRAPSSESAGSTARVFVNDREITSVALPPPNQLANPIAVDLSRFLSRGANRIQIRRGAGSPEAMAQVVARHYEPWRIQTDPAQVESSRAGALRLKIRFNKSDAKIGDEIACAVETERVGFRGYGMMLAEIGLPPGAEVDRASLDRAVKESDWGVDQYDVLPDRLIVYLWPRAGGTRFEFTFRARFGITAQTGPSVIYDYYNPEAKAVAAPTKFIVR